MSPVGQAHTLQKRHGLRLGLLGAFSLELHGSNGQVLHDIHMGEQVKLLKHHAHLLAVLVNVCLGIRYIGPLKIDLALCGFLQKVQTSQERTFARTGRAYHKHHITFVYIYIDSL